MKALLVEDDPNVAEALIESLEQRGWDVEHASDGRSAVEAVPNWDIILLDLNLPDVDGLEVCQRLRANHSVPLIAVTARSDQMDKVLCLRLGADDYIVKPYHLQELLARMTAVIRRSESHQLPQNEPQSNAVKARTHISHGPLTIDQWSRSVTVHGRELPLTRKEFELLSLLSGSPSRVFTREQLSEAVWSTSWVGASRTLDTHVAAVRRKLGDPGWIRTHRGVGFSFEPKH
ncbi:response regulator transcription factor [Streptomyces venezuelae]|uniref:DNA-binding response regulator n=1 Tax=Streptomyces venezuelae TaxID=54571 RepID=A0A5P2BVK9_STRVZ|nr:response regulator transcription factor [Streptomyces venezuelae]QES34504.1 DNA-binding response regulator [Streptomyces venezuelae]